LWYTTRVKKKVPLFFSLSLSLSLSFERGVKHLYLKGREKRSSFVALCEDSGTLTKKKKTKKKRWF